MNITEIIKTLFDIREKHGMVDVFLCDRYRQYEIKYCDYYEDINAPSGVYIRCGQPLRKGVKMLETDQQMITDGDEPN